MTVEKAIEILCTCEKTPDWKHTSGMIKEACRIVSSLKSPPNAPLTLDELSKIYDSNEGLIWATHGGVVTPAILDRYDGELVAVWSAMGIENALHEKDYGVLWLAYRRKPEEKTA